MRRRNEYVRDILRVTGKEAKPEGGSEVYEEWVRKNAMALHAIQISCGGDTMSKLRGNESAKFEWELLAEKIIVPLPHGKVEVKEQVTSTITEYRTLSKAVEEGDWEATRTFLEKKPEAISEKITLNGDTVLHVAVMAGQTEILKKLLASTGADLELKNDIGYTAFSIAAINGFKDMVEPMLERDENLVKLKDVHGLIPIVAASFYSSKEMVRYLYTKTPHEMLSPENTDRSGATLLNCLITDELYDVALHLLERYPSLGFVEDLHRNYAIRLLAHKRSAFPSGNRYVFCKQWIYSCMRVTSTQYEDEYPQSSDEESNIRIELKTNTQQVLLNKLRMLLWNLLTWIVPDIGHIYNRKSKHYEAQNFLKSIIKHIPYLSKEQLVKIGWDEAISDAIRNGITEFIDEVIESTPEIIWRKDKKGRTIFSHAIVQRQENIFSHIYGLGAKMRIAIIRHDIFHNNFLHLAAKLSPPSRLDRISGAALQMQRELEWFEEVSSILPPKYMEEVNENNKTPGELFTDEHQELMKQGESWMKNTAASCMVVATLIAAVMFTSAFTVPGGNDERRGTPIFLNRDAFLIFKKIFGNPCLGNL
ncbi:hypothetical protein Pint_27206 [Pistacia integerrima]|uniref:Uncharacterized protein n=1 Tax=Pistacia integerrima TaxID=434235 RepID=A0ACC0YNM0_9ROSI|nr:hypothetical protein Pint_27206 [Pistacia integerrima]